MKRLRQRRPPVEQLELFAERIQRPVLGSLPLDVRQRISELVAQMLLECLQANDAINELEEVIHER